MQNRCSFLNPLILLHPATSLLTIMSFINSGPCLLTHRCTTASLNSLLLSVDGIHPRASLGSALGVWGGLDNVKRIPCFCTHSTFCCSSLCTLARLLNNSLSVEAAGRCKLSSSFQLAAHSLTSAAWHFLLSDATCSLHVNLSSILTPRHLTSCWWRRLSFTLLLTRSTDPGLKFLMFTLPPPPPPPPPFVPGSHWLTSFLRMLWLQKCQVRVFGMPCSHTRSAMT